MNNNEPLAYRIRPKTLEEYVGQEHVLGKDKIKKEQEMQELTQATEKISGTKTKLEEKIENQEKIDEAMAALQVLGYNKKEIEKAFEKLVKENMTTEELIRKGLVALGK